MGVRQILRMGDPQLRQRSMPVAMPWDDHLKELILDLQDTMEANQGAGLAAPQIGVPLRVVVFGGAAINPRYPDQAPLPRTILINPVLTPLGEGKEDGWEGCLSVPGLRGKVHRWSRLRYQGFDESGNEIDRSVDGFHARVVQHECDHLDGILFPDKLRSYDAFGFTPELEATGLIPPITK